MKKSIFVFLGILPFPLHSQSPEATFLQGATVARKLKAIDFDYIDRQAMILTNDLSISPDGRYCAYRVRNQPYKSNLLFIRSTETGWQYSFADATQGGFFTADSHRYIVKVKDSLQIIALDGGVNRYITMVLDFEHAKADKEEWLFWRHKKSDTLIAEQLRTGRIKYLTSISQYSIDDSGCWLTCRTSEGGLLLMNLSTGREQNFPSVRDYYLRGDQNMVVFEKSTSSGIILEWVDLSRGHATVIWQGDDGEEVNQLRFSDIDASRLSFLTQGKGSSSKLWYYEAGWPEAIKKLDDNSIGMVQKGLAMRTIRTIRKNRYIIIDAIRSEYSVNKRTKNKVNLDIWSYHDKDFYTHQARTIMSVNCIVVLDIETGKVVPILNGDLGVSVKIIGDRYAVISKGMVGDRFWEYKRDSIWLVSLATGERRFLPVKSDDFIYLDPEEKFITYFDTARGRHYYRYDIQSGLETKISINVPDWILGVEGRLTKGWGLAGREVKHVIAAQTKGGSSVLVYDDYDIWELDLSGEMPLRNITNGYGRRNRIILRLLKDENVPFFYEKDSSLLLKAYDERNGNNGFYRLLESWKGGLQKLYMGPYAFDLSNFFLHGDPHNTPVGTMVPLKAANADVWLVKRQSAFEVPNYYISRGLKKFRAITDISQPVGYNWLSSELISFRQSDGEINQGVLYKPADFDSTKRYPVIFNYYEQKSQKVNCYPYAGGMNTGNIDIAWFVSRGYLVFTPDIYFEKGYRYSRSALRAMEGAAYHLMKLQYVDGKRLGLSGHSFAGGLTNYIITHSDLFAAALEGAGQANTISAALQLIGVEGERQRSRLMAAELHTGSNMWDRPEEWVAETPILAAHKVVTPLLILHSKKDGAVPFAQAVELFTALRRLNKPIWLLQYDEGAHGLYNNQDIEDFTFRATQFFDHYLLGKPAPKWMTQGIPRHLKGIEDGLELDVTEKEP